MKYFLLLTTLLTALVVTTFAQKGVTIAFQFNNPRSICKQNNITEKDRATVVSNCQFYQSINFI